MELILKVEEFRPDILKVREAEELRGVQYLFRFQNGYGASVIKHMINNFSLNFSYGHEMDLWELAVVKFIDESDCYTLVYDTPVTHDVIRYLTDKEVGEYLQKIKEL